MRLKIAEERMGRCPNSPDSRRQRQRKDKAKMEAGACEKEIHDRLKKQRCPADG